MIFNKKIFYLIIAIICFIIFKLKTSTIELKNLKVYKSTATSHLIKGFDLLDLSIQEPLVLINYKKHSIILHKGYKLPIYEIHKIYKKDLSKKVNYIRPTFTQDLNYKQFTYPSSIYKGTGFDRGHLFSAETASINPESYMECFLTTNIVPQNPELNRGEWKSLEDFCRKEAIRVDSITEINLLYCFEQNVKFKVPKYFTKILIYPDSTLKYWTFDNFKNLKIEMSIDSIEKKWNQEKKLKFIRNGN